MKPYSGEDQKRIQIDSFFSDIFFLFGQHRRLLLRFLCQSNCETRVKFLRCLGVERYVCLLKALQIADCWKRHLRLLQVSGSAAPARENRDPGENRSASAKPRPWFCLQKPGFSRAPKFCFCVFCKVWLSIHSLPRALREQKFLYLWKVNLRRETISSVVTSQDGARSGF